MSAVNLIQIWLDSLTSCNSKGGQCQPINLVDLSNLLTGIYSKFTFTPWASKSATTSTLPPSIARDNGVHLFQSSKSG